MRSHSSSAQNSPVTRHLTEDQIPTLDHVGTNSLWHHPLPLSCPSDLPTVSAQAWPSLLPRPLNVLPEILYSSLRLSELSPNLLKKKKERSPPSHFVRKSLSLPLGQKSNLSFPLYFFLSCFILPFIAFTMACITCLLT